MNSIAMLAATPSAIPTPSPGALRACLFVLGGERFAVQVEVARGVVVLEDITSVPGAPAHVLGIANLRGSLIPVIDVRDHLHLAAPWRDGPVKALVTEHASMLAAMAIDAVVGIESFADVLPPGLGARTRYGDSAMARLPGLGGGGFTLLDVPRIIDTLRIRTVSADDASGGTSRRRAPQDA